jgi:hypothetical protein
MAVSCHVSLFWDTMPLNLAHRLEQFRGSCCLHLQGGKSEMCAQYAATVSIWFELLTAVLLLKILWDVTMCCWTSSSHCFKELCYLHLQGRVQVIPKRWRTFTPCVVHPLSGQAGAGRSADPVGSLWKDTVAELSSVFLFLSECWDLNKNALHPTKQCKMLAQWQCHIPEEWSLQHFCCVNIKYHNLHILWSADQSTVFIQMQDKFLPINLVLKNVRLS